MYINDFASKLSTFGITNPSQYEFDWNVTPKNGDESDSSSDSFDFFNAKMSSTKMRKSYVDPNIFLNSMNFEDLSKH